MKSEVFRTSARHPILHAKFSRHRWFVIKYAQLFWSIQNFAEAPKTSETPRTLCRFSYTHFLAVLWWNTINLAEVICVWLNFTEPSYKYSSKSSKKPQRLTIAKLEIKCKCQFLDHPCIPVFSIQYNVGPIVDHRWRCPQHSHYAVTIRFDETWTITITFRILLLQKNCL